MGARTPVVTIGIPTYRRASLLRRAIASALAQEGCDVDVLVFDNASGDETEEVCRALAAADPRIRFHRHAENIGAFANFAAVAKAARGEYFMWLGDDDWIDSDYVRTCLALLEDPDVAAAGGRCHNYQRGALVGRSKPMDLEHQDPRRRIADYYGSVEDNPIFYGVMRREAIQACAFTNTLGADWLVMAQVAFRGKVRTAEGTRLHRERANATSQNLAHMVKSLGLPPIQERFPASSIALAAARDVLRTDEVFGGLGAIERRALAATVASILLVRVGMWMPLRLRLIPVLGQERATRLRSSASRAWSRVARSRR